MRKILLLYVGLILIFGIYILNYQYRESRQLHQLQEGLRGNIDEKYVMVTFQAGIEYWKSCLKGFEDAAEVLNVSVEYRGATRYDLHEQITVLEQIIARKPAGIAISAINPEELSATINKAVEAGIPVVLFDSGATTSKAYSFLATDNYQAGVTAARKLAELLNGSGQVAVLTQPNQLNHQERSKGFQETIQREFPRIQIAAVENGTAEALSARRVTEELLARHPEITGIFATQANQGVGVAEALSANTGGSTRTIKVIGFDTDKGTLDAVKAGAIDATLAQGTWKMGYWSLQFLFQVKHGLAAGGSRLEAGETSLPPYVDTGITVVTKTNVDQFYAK